MIECAKHQERGKDTKGFGVAKTREFFLYINRT